MLCALWIPSLSKFVRDLTEARTAAFEPSLPEFCP